MSNARNLRFSPISGIIVRLSMPHRDRQFIAHQQALTKTLEDFGVQNLPQMLPSGTVRRPNFYGGNRFGGNRFAGPRTYGAAAATTPPNTADGTNLFPRSAATHLNMNQNRAWRPQGRNPRVTNVIMTLNRAINPPVTSSILTPTTSATSTTH